MDKLIFTAVSGAERLQRAQQVHANNLANMDTSGFRASMEVAGNTELAGFGYDDRHLSTMQSDTVSSRAGTVRETGRPLDVAIGGQGYLAVQYGDNEWKGPLTIVGGKNAALPGWKVTVFTLPAAAVGAGAALPAPAVGGGAALPAPGA